MNIKIQCNDCKTIFTGMGSMQCPECSGEMHEILFTPMEEECNHGECRVCHDGIDENSNLYKRVCPFKTMEVSTIAEKTTLETVSNTDTLEEKCECHKGKVRGDTVGCKKCLGTGVREVPSEDCKPSSEELTSDCKPSEDWSIAFDKEFGIHFKDSPDELKFAIAFIHQTRQEAVEEYKRDFLDWVDFQKRQVEYGTPELEQQYEDRGFNQALSLVAERIKSEE